MPEVALGRYSRSLCVALLCAALAGCASTRIAHEWKDPEYGGGPLKQVAVFVAIKDENIRRFAEDYAVRNMPKGTRAVASHTLSETPDTEIDKIKARLTREGFDGVIMARLVSEDRTKTQVPPRMNPMPLGALYHPFYGYYPWAYGYAYTPGYTIETTTVIVEALVYPLPEGKLIWSGVSETVNPDSTLDLVTQLVLVVRKQLERARLIAAGEPVNDGK